MLPRVWSSRREKEKAHLRSEYGNLEIVTVSRNSEIIQKVRIKMKVDYDKM